MDKTIYAILICVAIGVHIGYLVAIRTFIKTIERILNEDKLVDENPL